VKHLSTMVLLHNLHVIILRCSQLMSPLNLFISTLTNPTIYDVRRDLVPLPKLPHTLYSHLISSLDHMMMAYIEGRNMYLFIMYHFKIVMLLCS